MEVMRFHYLPASYIEIGIFKTLSDNGVKVYTNIKFSKEIGLVFLPIPFLQSHRN